MTGVLITDAHTAAGVASVRSLGRRGIACVVAWHEGTFPLAATSRYCRGVVRMPDAVEDPDAFAERLLAYTRTHAPRAVMPISDAARMAMAPLRADIEQLAVVCAADGPSLAAAEDKWGILDRARDADLAVPPALLVEDREGWSAARELWPPPVVLRSRWSLIRVGRRLHKPPGNVHFAREPAERDIAERLARGESTIVTPYRIGTGRGIYLFMHDGRAAASFGHVRLRETNPQGSAACAAIPSMPTAEELSRSTALAASLGLSGSIMIEFRRGRESEPDWLVEINPRLWGSLPLAVHAGFDFPWWQFRYFVHGELPRMPEALPRVTGCRYLTAELGHLIHAARGAPSDWEGPYPSLREAWTGFKASFSDGWRYYHQDATDPLPGLAEPLTFVVSRLRSHAP